MPINMTDYKMIVHERVYNVLQIILDFDRRPAEDGTPPQPKFIDAVYIDEDGVIKTMRDEAWCFQFVRRNGGTANGKTSNNGWHGRNARVLPQSVCKRKMHKAYFKGL